MGSGSTLAPGEISLAHHGVKWWANLFLISAPQRWRLLGHWCTTGHNRTT
jgi:hypothetical protein